MVAALIQLLHRLAELFRGIARQKKIEERKDEADKIKSDPGNAWVDEFGVRDANGGSDKSSDPSTPSE